ncbi:MAG TPA: hypothetical protein PKY35_03100 [Candidatus Hydrogenedentes bacterium]|nr:hypothetical protein [Candidatus Hydrogenedentota bacterium]HOL75991.1 hypothetical protein [Candidatus Hydrogenedentota bacterium]HPO85833.1 hypothetical protein [Candidatus Hydrogenedentota bacterium]
MTHDHSKIAALEKALSDGNGILRLEPAWVARDFLAPAFRLGLTREQADRGPRGFICERWLASETPADNTIPLEGEGLSFLAGVDVRISLAEAVRTLPEIILGKEYYQKYGAGLHRLAKLFEYSDRLPYHIHQQQHDAQKVGANAKEEAYYFPSGVDMGPHPETFLGCHPYIVRQGLQEKIFLPYLEKWDSDLILQHAPAFKQIPGDGFHVPAGVLHAPGTAVTFELQENSDVFSMWQAKCGGKIISKELLFKDISEEDRTRDGERAALKQVNWELCGDPYIYENRHTPPVFLRGNDAGTEDWIFYNTDKFSGIRLIVHPGCTYISKDNGVYSLFVWRGKGTIGGLDVAGGDPNRDELLVTHDSAVKGVPVVNTGNEPLEIWKVFGLGVNPECPRLHVYKG